MKKYNVLVIILSILIMTLLSLCIGVILDHIAGRGELFLLWAVILMLGTWTFYPVYMNPLMILHSFSLILFITQ